MSATQRPAAAADACLTVLRHPDELEDHRAALEDLAGVAEVPNVYHEPWYLLPLARAFGGRERFRFLLVHAWGPAGRVLAGFLPLALAPFHPRLPVPCLRLWQDPHFYIPRCTPLVRQGHADAVAAALLGWLDGGDAPARLLDLRGMTGGTCVTRALDAALAGHRRVTGLTFSHESHLYGRMESFDRYLSTCLSSKRRENLRRNQRRLAREGKVEYVALGRGEDPAAPLDAFFKLEASGWKQAAGTAIATLGHVPLVAGLLGEAHRRGRLALLGLWVDGAPVAMRSALVAGRGSFAFKIGFDDGGPWARYSPGFLLELEALRLMHEEGPVPGMGLDWQDCCSAPDATMDLALRSAPLPIARYLVARRGGIEAAMLAGLPLARRALKAWKARRGAGAAPSPGADGATP